MVLFYHNNYYIGFSQQKAYWFLVSLFSWCGFDYAQPPKVEIIFFSPTLTSTTLSHRGGKLFYCMFLCIIFWNAKIFYYSYVFKEAKLAKFIRYEALWKLYIFYHKVLGDVVKRWRFWGLWGTLEIVKTWSWNILLYEEILHYSTLRSEWHGSVFYLRLGIWIIFEAQRF